MDRVAQLRQLRGFDSYHTRLGDILRGERATKGRSLLDVQRDLRIKAAYIAAIEDCEPSVFPNPGFIAGYVRSYARYLGMEPDQVFRQFCDESGFKSVNSTLAGERAPGSGPRPQATPVALKPVVPPGMVPRRRLPDIPFNAIGSVLVMLALIGGLGYGGMRVIESIQRVDIAPVDQSPGAQFDMAGLSAPGFSTTVELQGPAASGDAEPAAASSQQDLTRLYQPRELEVPIVTSRDGPVVDIDPDQVGAFRPPATILAARATGPLPVAQMIGPVLPSDMEPTVREAVEVPSVNVVARQPAWVRVYLADGTVLFEKILEAGEYYRLPVDVEAPLLRSGNSGAVYLVVNGQAYGPVGKGASVAKQVSLLPDDIRAEYPQIDELPDEIVASLSAMADAATLAPAAPLATE